MNRRSALSLLVLPAFCSAVCAAQVAAPGRAERSEPAPGPQSSEERAPAPAGDAAPRTGAAPVPAAYRGVMSRHGLDAAGLSRLGLAFVGELCVPVDADGRPAGPALTPQQLDARLTRRPEGRSAASPRPVSHPQRNGHLRMQGTPPPVLGRRPAVRIAQPPPPRDLPEIALEGAKDPQGVLDGFFDGKRRQGIGGSAVQPAASLSDPGATPKFLEPPFDGPMKPLALALWRGQKRAVRDLSARFRTADTETGLAEDAPEAMRLLALAIFDGKGGAAAREELRRQLRLVSFLPVPQKTTFARRLRSPLPIYVGLAVSHAPHFSDGQAYFSHLEDLLRASGLRVTDFIRQVDPTERFAADFLLRAHAYDALLPYLNREPAEAGAIVPLLFSERRPSVVRTRAAQIEGLAVQLAVLGRDSGALESFVRAAHDGARRAELSEPEHVRPSAGGARRASPPMSRKIALFLKLNAAIWPAHLRLAAEQTAALIPEGLAEDPRLLAATPYGHWPEDRWRFNIHTGRDDIFREWLRYFRARGYGVESTTREGVGLTKTVAGVTLTVVAKRYSGDEEGYLSGEEAALFQANVAKDLRDPGVQGVIPRIHAQFHHPALFRRGAAKGKLWVDGSCRSAWSLPEIAARCSDCGLVANTGTGFGEITTPVLYQVLEGLARKESWEEIGRRVRKALPMSSPRMVGPWTPDYGKALDLLKSYPKPAPAPNIPSSR